MINNKFWKGKKVLITGFSGFKGFWLGLVLEELGADVFGISKKNVSSSIFKEFQKIKKYKNNFYLDISDLDKLHKIMNSIKPDIVFHLAAQALVITSKLQPYETINTNIIGSYNLLSWVSIQSSDITTVVATTDKVYEFPYLNNKEDAPLGSFELYGATKVSVENLVKSFNHDKTFTNKISVVRSGNVLGGGDGGQNRILTDVLYSISNNNTLKLRNPNSIRPWQFILDSIGGYILTAQQHSIEKSYDTFNLNSSENNEYKVIDLTQKLLNKFDSKINIEIVSSAEFVESDELRIDSSKAKELLNWKNFYNLDDIVENIYKWENAKISNTVEKETRDEINYYLSNVT